MTTELTTLIIRWHEAHLGRDVWPDGLCVDYKDGSFNLHSVVISEWAGLALIESAVRDWLDANYVGFSYTKVPGKTRLHALLLAERAMREAT